MITINGIQFKEISGELDQPGMQLEDITRPGIDYQAFRQIGRRSNKVEIKVMRDYNSKVLADAAYLSYKSYEGYAVPVTVTRNNEVLVNSNVVLHKVVRDKQLNSGAIAGTRFSTVSSGANICYYTFILQVNS